MSKTATTRNADTVNVFRLYKILTWPVGIWPLQEHGVFSKARSCFSILIQIFLFICIYEEIIGGCSDANENLMENMAFLSCIVLSTIKIIAYYIYPFNMMAICKATINDYFAEDFQMWRHIINHYVNIVKWICLITLSLSYFAGLAFTFGPLVTYFTEVRNDISANSTQVEQWIPLPVSMVCTFRKHSPNKFIYSVIYFLQTLTAFSIISGNIGMDALFVGITLHICGQIEILKSKLRLLGTGKIDQWQTFMKLKKRHEELLDVSDLLIQPINFVLSFQFFLSSISIITIGFQVIIALQVGAGPMLWKTSFAFASFLCQLLTYSYVSDYLKNQMEDIGMAIYQSDWYNVPTNLARNLMFIMMRAHRPVQMVVYRCIVINMGTFMTVLRTIASYLSMLRVLLEI